MKPDAYRFSVAPMMDWTDRYCRRFHRSLSRHALLFTEMVTAEAVIHGDRGRLIGFDQVEHPVVLQLGGSNPENLAEASRIVEAWGYDEVNLNVGCPSDRVQSGAFGACLMKDPKLVAKCVDAMQRVVKIPVTVKNRIGVDDDIPEERLFEFTKIVSDAGVSVFSVHARKAILKGLSPKDNREIPPLDYELVHQLKINRPDLTIILNGGLDLTSAREQATRFDGVMLGRAAYKTPACLLDVDREFFGDTCITPKTTFQAAKDFRDVLEEQLEAGIGIHRYTRHMLGLFTGMPGARLWRRILSEKGPQAKGQDALLVYDEALEAVAP